MLNAYVVRGDRLQGTQMDPGQPLNSDVIWLDLLHPAPDEDKAIERLVGVEIPTREEMEEIEPSNRLYVENGARYMTASAVFGADERQNPQLTVVSFIVTEQALVSVRYEDLRPFKTFIGRVIKNCGDARTPEGVFLGLLEALVERNADIIENVGAEIDAFSHGIFNNPTGSSRRGRYQKAMRTLGQQADILSKAKESVLTIGRVAHFYAIDRGEIQMSESMRAELRNVTADVHSLADHSNFLVNKVTFLLDAVVGLVSIEQNEIIKLFSVVAVVFLPPTLVASIYGMNFQIMPELSWTFGYPFAIVVMIASAIVPYLIFKWKKWL